ncbi:MAG: hypothetical protein HY823_15400 [Acidobacteria bacterium]|nr:hypothetical protein [Acidobacteriota bacterium]
MDVQEVRKILKDFQDVPGTLRKKYICPTCYGTDTCRLSVFAPGSGAVPYARRVGPSPLRVLCFQFLLFGVILGVSFATYRYLPGLFLVTILCGAGLLSFLGISYRRLPFEARNQAYQIALDFREHAWICRRDATIWDPRIDPDGPGSGSNPKYAPRVIPLDPLLARGVDQQDYRGASSRP